MRERHGVEPNTKKLLLFISALPARVRGSRLIFALLNTISVMTLATRVIAQLNLLRQITDPWSLLANAATAGYRSNQPRDGDVIRGKTSGSVPYLPFVDGLTVQTPRLKRSIRQILYFTHATGYLPFSLRGAPSGHFLQGSYSFSASSSSCP